MPAISCGLAQRPRMLFLAYEFHQSGFSLIWAVSGVSTTPLEEFYGFDFRTATDVPGDELRRRYAEACARSRQIVARTVDPLEATPQ